MARRALLLGHAALVLAIDAGAWRPARAALPPAPNTEVRVSMTIDREADQGQLLGTLFEVTDEAGRPIAGAGFLDACNTQARSDRRLLSVYVRLTGPEPPDEEPFAIERLPRPSPDAGTYLFGFRDRLFARGRAGGLDTATRVWDPIAGGWRLDEEASPHAVQIGDAALTFTPSRIRHADQTVLEVTDGSIAELYAGPGILLWRRHGNEEGSTGARNELVACRWRPGEMLGGAPALITQPLATPREFVYAYGQRAGHVLAATNTGGVFVFGGDGAGHWQTIRASDPKISFQIYSGLNLAGRLLLGQYPSGELFEFDGERLVARAGWPPVMPGVRAAAREAQTQAIYGGRLYVGVWPWGELWRFQPPVGGWRFLGRMFSHPVPTEETIHPYERETQAIDPVPNRWGQRITSLVPWGDSLYIGTSAKTSAPREPKFAFLGPANADEYGAVYRHRVPGCLAVPFAWRAGRTEFEARWSMGRLSVYQDGVLLGVTRWAESAAVPSSIQRVSWGDGLHGPLAGRVIDRAVTERPCPPEEGFLGAYVDLGRAFDRDLPIERRQEQIDALLDRFRACGLRTVMPYANTSSGAVYYPSSVVARRASPDWDALGYFLAASRARGLTVWPAVCVLASGHFEPKGILQDHPEWALRQTDGRPWGFLSPAHPEARRWVVDQLAELVRLYQPDGILLDYLRYFNRPHQLDAGSESTLAREWADQQVTGPDLSARRQTRREETLTSLAGVISDELRRLKPDLKIGIYTWGPHVSRGHLVAQAWPEWVARGYVDMVNVSGYYYEEKHGPRARELYRDRLREAIQLARGGARVTVALGVETSHGKLATAARIEDYCRAAAETGVDGLAVFSWSALEPFLPELASKGEWTRVFVAPAGSP